MLAQVATKVHVEMVSGQFREFYLNTEFVAHPKHSTCKHASKVARFGVGGHQAITQHVAQGVQMVGNGVNVGERFGYRRELLGGHLNASLVQFRQKEVDQGITVNTGFNVHDAVQARHLAKQTVEVKFRPLVGDRVEAGQVFEPRNGLWINGLIDGWRAGGGPAKSLQSVAGVNDLKRHRSVSVPFEFNISVRVLFHVHEHERRQLQAANDDLNGGPGVASSAPRVFDVRDLVRWYAERLGEHSMTMLHARLHPIDFKPFIGPIKNVMRHHFEGREVSPRATNGVNIGQANARLGDGQWIGGRLNGTGGHVGLEISDGSDGEVNVVAPTSENRVGVDTDVFFPFKKTKKRLSHGVFQFLSTQIEARDERRTDERVFVLRGVPAGLTLTVRRPKPQVGDPALLSSVPVLFEHSQINRGHGHGNNLRR